VFRLGDPDPWHLSTDNDVGVNFVVSCLIKDGLQVAPFTDHPAGDGQLESARPEREDMERLAS